MENETNEADKNKEEEGREKISLQSLKTKSLIIRQNDFKRQKSNLFRTIIMNRSRKINAKFS